MVPIDNQIRASLQNFFSGRNTLKWDASIDQLVGENLQNEYFIWRSVLAGDNDSNPICLPCVSDDGSVEWYFGSRTLQGSHALAEELQAFIGPSYTSSAIRPIDLDHNDLQESALANIFVGATYKLVGRTKEEASSLQKTVASYTKLVMRRPSKLRASTRPFSIVRGLFDRALLAGNEESARSLINEMRKGGRLTSENTKFLEVRLMAGLGQWDQIVLKSQLLSDLSDFNLPPRIVRDVSEAFFRIYIEPFDAKGGLEDCLENLRHSSILKIDRVFAQRHNIRHPNVVKTFLLRELLHDPIDLSYARAILESLHGDDKSALIKEIEANLGAEISEEQDSDLLQKSANAAFLDGDYDRALNTYKKLTPDQSSIQHMIACAKLAGDQKSAGIVLEIIQQVDANIIFSLSENAQKNLEALENQAHSIPSLPQLQKESENKSKGNETNWLEWAEWVSNGAQSKLAIDTLHQHIEEWLVSDLMGGSKSLERFAETLGNASGDAELTYRQCFTDIFTAFVQDVDDPSEEFKLLYKNLLFLLATSDAISSNDLTLSAQLVSPLLSFGLTPVEYEDVIEQLLELFKNHGALKSFDWSLDVAEMLVLEQCRDIEARLRFFTEVSNFANRSSHRITNAQRLSLEVLYYDFSLELPDNLTKKYDDDDAENDEDGIGSRLSGKKIAIYTLMEGAGRRALVALKKIAPNADIRLNNDHDCTNSLKVLAASADIFVFAWKSSKHQAFYCIKNHRPPELPFLQPMGKGSASIISEIIKNA